MTNSNKLCSDVAVVIRTCGERTEALCEQLVLQQVPREHVVVINERPFNKALKVSYEVGLDGGLPWTLCVDGDVLLSKQAIRHLITVAYNIHKKSFGLQARVLDKFFGGDRLAGYHFYRTCLLEKARALIPNSDQSMRPETYVMRQMVMRGHDYHLVDNVLALHDYEQFYRDIYRKMVVQARKGRPHVAYLLSRALSLLEDDLDYKIAAYGLCAGLNREGTLVLDASAWIEEADSLLRQCGIEEKAQLDINDWIGEVDRVLGSYVSSKAYQEYASQYMQGMMRSTLKPAVRMKDRLLELGALRAVPWGVGNLLQLVGSSLVRRSERK